MEFIRQEFVRHRILKKIEYYEKKIDGKEWSEENKRLIPLYKAGVLLTLGLGLIALGYAVSSFDPGKITTQTQFAFLVLLGFIFYVGGVGNYMRFINSDSKGRIDWLLKFIGFR